MGVRGEIYSNRVILPNRTYFFNVKENRVGDLYLNIVESKNRDTGGFDRQSVILFADDLQDFLKGFDESLKVMEKAVRGKKHGGEGGTSAKREEGAERGERPEREKKFVHSDRAGRGDKAGYGERAGHGDRPERKGKFERGDRTERGERGPRKFSSDKPKSTYGSDRGDRGRKNERGAERGAQHERGGRSGGGKSRVVVKKRER